LAAWAGVAVGKVCSRTGQPCSRSPRGNFAVHRTARQSLDCLRVRVLANLPPSETGPLGCRPRTRARVAISGIRPLAAQTVRAYRASHAFRLRRLSRSRPWPLKRVHPRRDTASAGYRLLVSLAPERFYHRLAAVHLRRRLYRQANAPSFPPHFLCLRVFLGSVPN
jgi:hypothetical protein